MALTTAGRDHIAGILIGEALTDFNNGNSYLAVGNSTAAFSAAHTDLQGASKARKGMDATYPTRATNVLTFKATFATTDANFAWEEWAVTNATSGGTMLNRKVESLGTKTSAASWALTATITVTAS